MWCRSIAKNTQRLRQVSFRILTKLKLSYLDQTLALLSLPKSKFKISTKPQLQNVDLIVINMFLSIDFNKTNSIKKFLGQSNINRVYSTAVIEFLVNDKGLTSQWSDLGPIIKSQILGFRQNILFHDSWRFLKVEINCSTNSMFTKYHWRDIFRAGMLKKDWQRGQEKLSYKIGQVLLFGQDWDTTGPHHPRAGRCPGPPWCPARSSAATGGPWWPEERVH